MERTECEIYSRVSGYLSPTKRWNEGKTNEFKDRKMFEVAK
jgi:ribonucleoside-triphosphate reductase